MVTGQPRCGRRGLITAEHNLSGNFLANSTSRGTVRAMSHLRPIEQYEASKYEVHIAPRAHAQLESLPAEVSERIEQGLGDLAEIADCQMVRMTLCRVPETGGSSLVELNVAEGCVACLRINDTGRTITLVEVAVSNHGSPALMDPAATASAFQSESHHAYRAFRGC